VKLSAVVKDSLQHPEYILCIAPISVTWSVPRIYNSENIDTISYIHHRKWKSIFTVNLFSQQQLKGPSQMQRGPKILNAVVPSTSPNM
jgi:hypothetical protein